MVISYHNYEIQRSEAYLPGFKADFLDNSRLYNLLSREAAPSDCICGVGVNVGEEVP